MMATSLDSWTDDGVGPGGTVGGDGASESVSRRFTRAMADGTFAVVDTYYYPVNIGERWGEEREDAELFDVENMTMFTICADLDDVGGSESWSDVDYDFPSYVAFADEAEAMAYCLRMVSIESGDMYGDPESWAK